MWSFSVRPLMVIWLRFDDLINVKVHLMMALVDMALNSLEFSSKLNTAFLCSDAEVSCDLSLWY